VSIFSNYIHIVFFIWFSVLSIVFFEPAPFDILFVPILAMVLLHNKVRGRKLICLFQYLDKELVLFIAVTFLGLYFADNFKVGLMYSIITLYLILTTVVVRYYLDNGGKVEIILKGYIVSALIALVLGLLPYYTGIGEMFIYDNLRVKGPFKDPNVFGSYFVPAAIIMLEEIRNSKYLNWSSVIKILLAALLLWGVVVPFSRGAWLNIAAAGLVYMIVIIRTLNWETFKKYASVLAIFILITGGSIIGTSRLDFLFSRLGLLAYDQDRFSTQAESLGLGIRVKYNTEEEKLKLVHKDSAEINRVNSNDLDDTSENIPDTNINILLKKLIGISAGQYEENFERSAHSLLIRTIVENGLLGVILLFVFIGKVFFRMIKGLLVEASNSPIFPIPVLLAVLTGIMVNGLFIDTIHWRHMWVFFALVTPFKVWQNVTGIKT